MASPFKLFGETGKFPCGKLHESDEGELRIGVTSAMDSRIYMQLYEAWNVLSFDWDSMPAEMRRGAVHVCREALDEMLKGFERKPFSQWCDEQWTDEPSAPSSPEGIVQCADEFAAQEEKPHLLGRIQPQPPTGIKYCVGGESWLAPWHRTPVRLVCEEWGHLGPMVLDQTIQPNKVGFRVRTTEIPAPNGAHWFTLIDGVYYWTLETVWQV